MAKGKVIDKGDRMMQEALVKARAEVKDPKSDVKKESKWELLEAYDIGFKTAVKVSVNRRKEDGLISLDLDCRGKKSYQIKMWSADQVCFLTAILKENLEGIAKHFEGQIAKQDKKQDKKTA